MSNFFQQLDERIARYDLLKHPFYQAWSAGELTRDDLREYASEYWHHVSAFPSYLSAFHSNLTDSPLRRTVLENLVDEEGLDARPPRPHSDLWMDFATAFGTTESEVRARTVQPETAALIATFRDAMSAQPTAALAALYAYESRVPAISATKAAGLKQHYNAPDSACRYFTLHQTADVHHAQVWRDAINSELAAHPESASAALDAAETAAAALWSALDGIERRRTQPSCVAQ
jgi:pyrroloquinoline-quinone synthase